MSTTAQTIFDTTQWDAFLPEVARRHHVPGIVAGALSIDPSTGAQRRMVTSTGVTNTRTGVPSDRDTVCQIGSITKLVTATMIMQLCEEGKLDLETKVVDVLPDFALASTHGAEITVWNLLTHTSGIDGDLFTDTGRGDDCVEKYIATLRDAESLFTPKSGWSYCNSGFVVAGRIIEVLDGQSWDTSVKERISGPLGLDGFFTLPEEILAHRHQYGHVRRPGQKDWHPAPVSNITRSMGAAGVITSSVDNLLDFGAAFLRGGDTGSGGQLLTVESIETMTAPQWTLDPAVGAGMAPQWGFGWMLDEWEGHKVQWHGGTTIGNKAWFQVLPDDGLVFVVFCNGGLASHAAHDIYAAFAQVFAGIRPSPEPRPTGPALQATLDDSWLGSYSDAGTSLEVARNDDGTYRATISQANLERRLGKNTTEPGPLVLLPTAGPNRFIARSDHLEPWSTVSFTEVDGRPVAYVGIRCLPRREAETGSRPLTSS